MFINENSKAIIEDLEKKLKITDVDMGGYKIKPILSLMALPTSPKKYGRPPIDNRPLDTPTKVIYDGTFI